MELPDSSYAFLDRILQCKSLRVCDDDLTEKECQDFWTSEGVAEFFKAHGYTPYRRDTEESWPGVSSLHTIPSLPYDIYQEADYPYAYHHAQPESDVEPSLNIRNVEGRVMYAQDRKLKHVSIKVLHIESEEYRINHFLSQQSLETMRENCLMPVIELLYFRKACFVVMPRWGPAIYMPECHTMRSILFMMKSFLKGLAFLHSHNIIHRDISFSNILVNHFGKDSHTYLETREPQMSAGLLSYALIDFDISTMLPNTVDRKTYRLPWENTLAGSGGPCDVAQGEFGYDPFAYDVGCLGYLFCEIYQHHTQEEALQFVQRIMVETTPAQLSLVERPNMMAGAFTYETYDRWQGLPADFQKDMAAYREPLGVPLISKVLRAIVYGGILPRSTVPTIRRFFV